MKKILFLTVMWITIITSAVFCGLQFSRLQSTTGSQTTMVQTVAEPDTTEPNTAEPNTAEPNTTEAAVTKLDISKPIVTTYSSVPVEVRRGETIYFKLNSDEEKTLLGFKSSDDSVASVDSGGRIDAKKEGVALITAEFSDYSRRECKVTVTKAQEQSVDRFSTAVTANLDVVEKNKKSNIYYSLYSIKVNRRMNCVTVYTYDDNGNYNVPVRAMVCSTGKSNATITGDFSIYFKREWNPLYQGVYGHYTSGISGDYLFHSVPYYSPNPSELEVEEFNKLGEQASLGCVRLACADTKWIYDNCPENTPITIYDDDNPGPLGKPETIKITDKSCGWDPTDSNKDNPYNSKAPIISGAKDVTINQNDDYDMFKGITAVDTCSNDITDKLKVEGNVVNWRKGTYKVTYSVTDVLHRTASVDITVTVK